MTTSAETWLSLGVALGGGLLIGVERERRKREGPTRAFAGVRTFAIVAVGGALASVVGQPLLVLAAAVLLIALIAIAYARSGPDDPGITTEVALFVTFLIGVAATVDPAASAASAVVVAILLATRTGLHRFSVERISESELRDLLMLAGAALVVLPILPDVAAPNFGGFNPRRLWLLVVMLLSLQAAGHVAVRLFGSRIGLPAAGFASGFVSSTATFGAMGRHAAAEPGQRQGALAGALASSLATPIQMSVVLATVSPELLALTARAWVASVVATLVAVGIHLRRQAALPESAGQPAPRSALSLARALGFALTLAAVSAATAWVAERFGGTVAIFGAVAASVADVHSASAAIAQLVAGGSVPAATAVVAVFAAYTINGLGKLVAALVLGGRGFAVAALPGSLACLLPVWIVWAVGR